MPSSGLTEMRSVSKQAASNTRSSLAPAGSTLGSPVGSGNPNSDIVSSTVCEAMKSLLLELQCVTSVFEQRQSHLTYGWPAEFPKQAIRNESYRSTAYAAE